MIMFFNLYNAPITFQVFINDVLKEYLNVFYIAYFNDIFIYNNIKEKHFHHINKMLNKLQKIELYFDINKCDFYIIRIKYLDLIIIINEVEINLKKIKIICQEPISLGYKVNKKNIREYRASCTIRPI